MNLKTFLGCKGVVAFAESNGVKFAILANNPRDLARLWPVLLPAAAPLDPAGLKRAILIEAPVLRSPPRAEEDAAKPSVESPRSPIIDI